MKNETYRIIKSDLIPITGLISHSRRTSADPNHLDYVYQGEDALRSVGLLVYNITIIGAPVLGLAKLLLK
jgi:hypothetical protein